MVIKKNIKQKGVWFLKKKPNRKNKIILNEGRDLNNLIFFKKQKRLLIYNINRGIIIF